MPGINGNILGRAPPDGFVDNPKDVNELLLKYPMQIGSENVHGGSQVDDIISKELLQLSFRDRNAINEEMHGVQNIAPEETPEMLAEALRDMETEIIRIPTKVAYNCTQEFSSTVINISGFRLRFLYSGFGVSYEDYSLSDLDYRTCLLEGLDLWPSLPAVY